MHRTFRSVSRPFPPAAPTPDAVPELHSALHVLVVDDQLILSQILCEQLQHDLHTVETATSGYEALEKFRADHLDVVITDHVMPGMTGEKLAVAIKSVSAKTPAILLNGYGGTAEAGHYSEAIDCVLGKSLVRATLREALAQTMTPG